MCFAFAAFAIAGASNAEEFEIIAPNETALEVADGIITARLSGDGCASGFDTACTETRQRAEYQQTTGHGHGDQIAYRWEIKVVDNVVLNAVDKHLYATRFLNGEANTVLQFYLSDEYGYEVNRKTCFGPEEFGQWHQIEVRVTWDSTKREGLGHKTPGEMTINCDGTEVFATSGRPNIKEGDEVSLALGLEGTLRLAEGDDVSVSFRNIEIGSW